MTAAAWLARARAVTDGATEGPWWHFGSWPFEVCGGGSETAAQILIAGVDGTEADAEFATASRTLLPAAVAAIEAVLALHVRGDESSQGYMDGGGYGYIAGPCTGCVAWDEYAVEWPCDTVIAITAALDGATS